MYTRNLLWLVSLVSAAPLYAADVPANTPLAPQQVFRYNNHSDPGTLDPQKVEEIAGAMTFLLENPDRAKAMGEAGRKLALKKYCWQSEEKRLLTLYRKLLEGEKA